MTTPTNPRREHPSTYFVQDRSNQEELNRVSIQDHIITTGMGGVLPEQPNPAIFQRVLDVSCGTGGWLIEAAKTYLTMSRLVGVDVSSKMVEYARAQAADQQVDGRVHFQTMDALRMLEFPSNYFDLVNLRFGVSYLRKWDWPKLLREFQRVSRPDGVIRITEPDMVESTSPALMRREQLLLQAFFQAGHFFTPDRNGVTSELVPLLHRYGIHNVQTRIHTLEYRAGTIEGQYFAEDMGHGFRTLLPFMRKWGQMPDDYETIYQQMLSEMQQPDFVATWNFVTAWGRRS
ncbi:MAG TPA: class I SAM-dependent methyltransferase [Ktedonobacteraceae bacterium]|nr:class I SAM-dependent methyltransferase [Ktedonobacteraceae bacterium]